MKLGRVEEETEDKNKRKQKQKEMEKVENSEKVDVQKVPVVEMNEIALCEKCLHKR